MKARPLASRDHQLSATQNATPDAFLQTNPFALLTISNACANQTIVASRDIVDDRGTKLWARDLRVTPELHQRLIQRKLRHPVETSLRVEDGVTSETLLHDLQPLIEGDDPLANLFRPCATALQAGLKTLPLHPVVQLLLTAAQQITPASYQHALRASALTGALAWHAKAPTAFLQRAMLVGLVHDLGEMYVNPEYLKAGRQLDLAEYRQLAAHPHVGSLLLAQMTDYPADIARAVCEHHERLDGTGYPFQLLGAAISPLGQLMAVAELVLGIVDARPAAAARASFALKFVPGEFSGLWAGPVTRWADTEPRAEPEPAQADAAITESGALDQGLQRIQAMAESVAESLQGGSQRVAQRAAHRLRRLRIAWNAMGLWSLPEDAIEPHERFDIALAMRELRYRINTIGRDCLWPETDPSIQADAKLVPLWLTLASAGKPAK